MTITASIDSTETDTAADAALARLGAALKAQGYAFTTVTPATHARVNARPENARAHDLRGVFGWSRPFPPDLLPAETVALMDEAGVLDRGDDGLWRSTVRFSSYDGQLLAHSAFPTDDEDSVFLGPDTYRLVDAVTGYLGRRGGAGIRRAVDVGSGTGAGAIAIASRAPDAEVFAADINPLALRRTRSNAQLAGVRVQARHSDLLDGVDGDFDLIVSNPPFMIDPAGRAYRDGGGSTGHDLPLRLVDAAVARLTPGGALVMLCGAGITADGDPLRAAVAERFSGGELSWDYREIDPDVYGEELDGAAYRHAERIAVVVLEVTRPD